MVQYIRAVVRLGSHSKKGDMHNFTATLGLRLASFSKSNNAVERNSQRLLYCNKTLLNSEYLCVAMCF